VAELTGHGVGAADAVRRTASSITMANWWPAMDDALRLILAPHGRLRHHRARMET